MLRQQRGRKSRLEEEEGVSAAVSEGPGVPCGGGGLGEGPFVHFLPRMRVLVAPR